MRDALAVSEDERRSFVFLRVAQGLDRLLRAAGKRDLGDVDIARRDRLQGQILARRALAGRGELGRGPDGGRLRSLAAGVGIDFGVQHQDVDVARLRQDMIKAARADVVGPAVAADDPQAAAHEVLGQGKEIPRQAVGRVGQRTAKLLDPRPLRHDLTVCALRSVKDLFR